MKTCRYLCQPPYPKRSRKSSLIDIVRSNTYVRPQKTKHKAQNRVKEFVLDRKDPAVINYFTNTVALDKRLSKNRMKEFLVKRYKEYIADRVLKNIVSFFNSFVINVDFGMFCDSIENFANQEETVRRFFD